MLIQIDRPAGAIGRRISNAPQALIGLRGVTRQPAECAWVDQSDFTTTKYQTSSVVLPSALRPLTTR